MTWFGNVIELSKRMCLCFFCFVLRCRLLLLLPYWFYASASLVLCLCSALGLHSFTAQLCSGNINFEFVGASQPASSLGLKSCIETSSRYIYLLHRSWVFGGLSIKRWIKTGQYVVDQL